MFGLEMRSKQHPCSESCFPKAMMVLKEHAEEIMAKKLWNRMLIDGVIYRDLMDMVAINVWPELAPVCISFYGGRGLRLLDIYSSEELSRRDKELVVLLNGMIEIHGKARNEARGFVWDGDRWLTPYEVWRRGQEV